MPRQPFDRYKHIYHNEAFDELIKDAIRFFHGTPVHGVPPPERFAGQGVYALYYTGNNRIYKRYKDLNRLAYDAPIYVGKAVPSGWRQGRGVESATNTATLYNRIKQHAGNIECVEGIELKHISCRFVIFEGAGTKMISTIESELIRLKRPLWNSALDGFGNHTPGEGRFRQAKSAWDVMHPGRSLAARCMGKAPEKKMVLERISRHLASI